MNESICTLGYHSHRGWVIRPQVFLLYDKILMNKESYESAIYRGEIRESSFAYIVSELLKEYRKTGVIELRDYEDEVEASDKELVDGIVERWVRSIPQELGALLRGIYSTQADVWEERLQFMKPREPAYSRTVDEINTFREWLPRVERGELNIVDKEIIIHYMQQVMFTNKIVAETSMPVFDWPSNVHMRSWILSTLPLPETQRKIALQHIEQATMIRTLNALVEVVVEDQVIIDDKQVAKFLEKRSDLKGVRKQIEAINRTIWEFVRHQIEMGYLDALDTYIPALRSRVEKLKRDLKSIELEKSTSPKKRVVISAAGIITGAATAVASVFLPVVPGIAKAIIDKVSEPELLKLGDKLVESKYPDIQWTAVYQDVYAKSLTARSTLSVKLDSFSDQRLPEYGERDICNLVGISKAELFKYEDEGLIKSALRDRYNRRVYTDEHLDTLMRLLLN